MTKKPYKEKSTQLSGRWITSYSDTTRASNGRMTYHVRIGDEEFTPGELIRLKKILDAHLDRIATHKEKPLT